METKTVETVPNTKFIVSFTCGDETEKQSYGTGVLLRTDDLLYDIIITAGHCLVKGCEKSLVFDDNSFDVVRVHLPKNFKENSAMDFGAIIIRKVENTADLPMLIEKAEMPAITHHVEGFPFIKRETPEPLLRSEVKYNKIADDGRLIYTLTLSDSKDYSKKELLEGISGGAIYSRIGEELNVYSIAVNTGCSDGAYDELYAISIKSIIDYLKEEDVLYFHEGNMKFPRILHEMLELPDHPKADNQISAILIGKSGAGKSAFAKTFMKHGATLDVTGETQTTRSTIEYQIELSCKSPSIKVTFMNKDEFVKQRIKRCCELLAEDGSYTPNESEEGRKVEENGTHLPSISDYDLTVGQLCEKLMEDQAFFAYEELKHLREGLLDDIDGMFVAIFGDPENRLPNEWSKDEYISVSAKYGQKDIDIINDEDARELTYSVDDMAELFLRIIHGYIMVDIRQKYALGETSFTKNVTVETTISDLDREFINYSLKVCDGRLSISALVKTVVVIDRVSDDYRSCFVDNGLKQLILIDTYGLDHGKMATSESIKERIFELSQNHHNIDFVFYIRKLLTDPPTDIQTIIPLLYKAKPGIRVYTIFTCIDENAVIKKTFEENIILDLDALKINLTAVKYFQPAESRLRKNASHKIVSILEKEGVSTALAQSIYENMRDHIVLYCASEIEADYKKFRCNNISHMGELLRTIIQKEYLGNGIINIQHIERIFNISSKQEDTMEKLSDLLGKMFQFATIKWTVGVQQGTGHWKTQQTNINRLRKSSLGYWGRHNHEWNYVFNNAYNEIFSVLSEEDFNTFFDTDSELNDAVAIRQFLNDFGEIFLGCKKHGHLFQTDMSVCRDCEMSDSCFATALLSCYDQEELGLPVSIERGQKSRAHWLNSRTNFGMRFEENKDVFLNLFIKNFIKHVVPLCKKHNGRIIAKNEDIRKDFLDVEKKVREELREYETVTTERIIEVFKSIKEFN